MFSRWQHNVVLSSLHTWCKAVHHELMSEQKDRAEAQLSQQEASCARLLQECEESTRSAHKALSQHAKANGTSRICSLLAHWRRDEQRIVVTQWNVSFRECRQRRRDAAKAQYYHDQIEERLVDQSKQYSVKRLDAAVNRWRIPKLIAAVLVWRGQVVEDLVVQGVINYKDRQLASVEAKVNQKGNRMQASSVRLLNEATKRWLWRDGASALHNWMMNSFTVTAARAGDQILEALSKAIEEKEIAERQSYTYMEQGYPLEALDESDRLPPPQGAAEAEDSPLRQLRQSRMAMADLYALL